MDNGWGPLARRSVRLGTGHGRVEQEHGAALYDSKVRTLDYPFSAMEGAYCNVAGPNSRRSGLERRAEPHRPWNGVRDTTEGKE